MEPDYSTDNSDDDDDEDERVRDGGEVGHDAGNIYEQVKEVKKVRWNPCHVMKGIFEWRLDS